MKELVLKKCLKCGALVEVLKDCTCENCGLQCCGQEMIALKPNSVDAAFEKHVPTYEIAGDEIVVRVNHVMEEEHFIEWIAYVRDNKVCKVFLKAGEDATAKFKYENGAKLYAYCNKHGLWSSEIK